MIQILPTRDRRAWNGQYSGRIYGDIQESFNIDLFSDAGRLLLSKRAVVETTSDSLYGWGNTSSFMRSDASGAMKLWAAIYEGALFYSSGSSITSPYNFTADTTTGAPNNSYDMAIHEIGTNNNDRLVVSTLSGDIAILNNTNHVHTWIGSWWKSRVITSSTDPAGPNPISILCTGHGFSTGDTITISGHLTNTPANGQWVITVTDVNNFTLNGSVGTGGAIGAGSGGICGYLNQSAMTNQTLHPLDVFNRTLLIGDDRYVHSVDRNDVVQYRRLTLPQRLKIKHIFHTKTRVWLLCYDVTGMEGAVIEWDGFSPNYLYEHAIDAPAAMTGIAYNDQPLILTSRGRFKLYNGNHFEPLGLDLPIFEENLQMSYSTIGQEYVKPRGIGIRNNIIYVNIMEAINSNGRPLSRRMKSGLWALDIAKKSLTHYAGAGNGVGNDFGQAVIHNVGAVMPWGELQNELLFSANSYSALTIPAHSSVTMSISPDFSTTNRGWFRTTKMTAQEVSEMWSTMYIRFKKFVDSGNKIIIKSRTDEPYQTSTGAPVTANITWVNTTSFTCTVPSGVKVGDEVEVLSGDNAGCLFHIANIVGTTITIDEAAPKASTATALVKFDNWIKQSVGVITDTTLTKIYTDVPVPGNGPYLEITVEMRGVFMAIDELLVATHNNETLSTSSIKRGQIVR